MMNEFGIDELMNELTNKSTMQNSHLWPKKRENEFFSNISNDRLPLKSVVFASKLCENALRTIPDILFFDVEFSLVAKFLALFNVFARFLRSYANSDVTSRFLAIFCFRLTH